MSKTYFVTSDIHGYFAPFRSAWQEAGFDPKNPDHVLVVCGDIFDRGDEPKEVYRFLKRLPKGRRILIRGNHEFLLRDLLQRGKAESYDYHNGTVRTLARFAGVGDYNEWRHSLFAPLLNQKGLSNLQADVDKLDAEAKRVLYTGNAKAKEVVDWIFSDDWVNYWELEDMVFVHSWVPLVDKSMMGMYYAQPESLRYWDGWKTASLKEWEDATWGCPWRYAQNGTLNPPGKRIVCGHWGTEDFHFHLGPDHRFGNRDIYYGTNCIALDATTALAPHVCNMMVIRDGVCYNKNGDKLEVAK